MSGLRTPSGPSRGCAVSLRSATSRHRGSFDHIVGAGEQRRRHVEAERLGGLQVEHELELGQLHDRQVSGLIACENAAGIDAHLAIGIRELVP